MRAAESRDRNAPFQHLHVIDHRRARHANRDIGAERRVGGVVGLQRADIDTRGRVVDDERHARQLRGVRRATLDDDFGVRRGPSLRSGRCRS